MTSWMDRVKNEYQKQAERQKELTKYPDLPETQRNARVAGGIMLILGIAFAIANYFLWVVEGTIRKLPLAAMIAFTGLGIWALITGKFPSKK